MAQPAEKVRRDPMAGRYKKGFALEFRIAEIVLKPYGGALEWSKNDYEAFRFTSPTVTLIFYPHKTSAMNYHIRVRDQGSKDKRLADELMVRLRIGNGFNCTFHSKNNWTFQSEMDLAKTERLEHGWARRQANG